MLTCQNFRDSITVGNNFKSMVNLEITIKITFLFDNIYVSLYNAKCLYKLMILIRNNEQFCSLTTNNMECFVLLTASLPSLSYKSVASCQNQFHNHITFANTISFNHREACF